jgi:cytochrome c peroxidase
VLLRKGFQIGFLFMAMISFLLVSWREEITSKEELGRKLFFDTMLSKNKNVSCGSCHLPAYAFADTLPKSVGHNGNKTKRNTPTVMNMGARSSFFFDGRVTTLEEQIFEPIIHKDEMGFSEDGVIKRLKKDREYKTAFSKYYKEGITKNSVSEAIGSYIRQLETSNSPFDQWMRKESSLSESAIRGRELFLGDKAKCFGCHFSPDFTADEFKNIGIYDEKQFMDKGRYEVSKKPEDIGRFKVPGLRNVAMTSPYMHNGMFVTLAEVVEYYNNPRGFISKPINMDSTLMKPLGLTAQEKYDLVSFLISLTDVSYEVKKDHYKKFGS